MAAAILVVGVAGGAYVGHENQRQRAEVAAEAAARARAIEVDEQRHIALAGERADRSRREAEAEAAALAEAEAEAVAQRVSRAEEAAVLAQTPANPGAPVGSIPASCGDYSGNRATGCALLLEVGFGLDQMPCLDNLWTRESGWNELAGNQVSGAYGIPQSLPGNKMASFGDDWETNPATQIRWGLSYIGGRYSDPCGAWGFFLNNGFY